MSRGKRYDSEPKLNIKKVIAVLLVIAVIVMFVIAIKKIVFSDNSARITAKTYFSAYLNNKWGVIDNSANIVIEPIYDEMIIIPDKNKDVFICTENVNYENNTYTTKVINSKNSEILKSFDKVLAIENYDEYNNLWYEDNVLKYEKNGKYGLINIDGKIILEAEYEDIYALRGIKNAIITVKEEKVGLVDNKGVTLVPNDYEEIRSLGKDTNLYIVKDDVGNYGIYNKLDTMYQEIKPLNSTSLYCVKENDKYKVINEEQKEVLNEKFDDIKSIKENVIIYISNKKCGAYDTVNNKNIKASYSDIIYTSQNNFVVKNNSSYGIIDIDETIKEKIEYAGINYYEDAKIYELEPKNNTSGENIILNKDLKEIAKGIINEVVEEKSYIKMWTEDGYKYYSLLGEEKNATDVLKDNKIFLKKQDGKYGYVDKEGNIVVDFIYDDAKEQNTYGYAAVKKDGKWGAIDTSGKIICDTIYNLDENLLIDFIGKYHLGKDVNLQYYTEN